MKKSTLFLVVTGVLCGCASVPQAPTPAPTANIPITLPPTAPLQCIPASAAAPQMCIPAHLPIQDLTAADAGNNQKIADAVTQSLKILQTELTFLNDELQGYQDKGSPSKSSPGANKAVSAPSVPTSTLPSAKPPK